MRLNNIFLIICLLALIGNAWIRLPVAFGYIQIFLVFGLFVTAAGLFRNVNKSKKIIDRNLLLRSSIDTFFNSNSPQEVIDSGIKTAIEIVHAHDRDAVVNLVLIGAHEWEAILSSHPRGEGLRGMKRIDSVLDSIFGYSHAPHDWNPEALSMEIEERFIKTFPIRLEEGQKATLVIDGKKKIAADIVAAVDELSKQISLAANAVVQRTVDEEHILDSRFRALLQHAPDAVFITDLLGHCLFANDMGENLLRRAGNTRSIFLMIHPQDRPAFVSLVQNSPHSENYDDANIIDCRIATTDSSDIWLEFCALDLTNNSDIQGIVIHTRSVTHRKLLEYDLRHRVLHDGLTGIPNLAFLKERADFALSFRRTDQSVAAVLYIAITNFSNIRKSIGENAANDILKIVAFRLDNYVRGHDTAARLSDSNFGVLLQQVRQEDDVGNVVARLLDIITRPIEMDHREIAIKAAIGVCIAQPEYTVDVFLRNAEIAAYEAYESKTQVATYSGSLEIEAGERVKIRRDLAHAVEKHEFVLNFQPLIELATNRLCGLEALLRWVNPTRGTVSPGVFIPIAEESGLITSIGEWVLQDACQKLVGWHNAHPDKSLQVHVNISNRQLDDHRLIPTIENILDRTGVDPSSVVLELTESRNLHEREIKDRLFQLHRLGFDIATDEFGGSFNSYAVLQSLPITMVKIDRSLILALTTNYQKASNQLRKLVQMAHASNVLVIAEGIEEADQRDALAEMGVDRAQGYYFGKPVSAGGISTFLALNTNLIASANK